MKQGARVVVSSSAMKLKRLQKMFRAHFEKNTILGNVGEEVKSMGNAIGSRYCNWGQYLKAVGLLQTLFSVVISFWKYKERGILWVKENAWWIEGNIRKVNLMIRTYLKYIKKWKFAPGACRRTQCTIRKYR